MPVSVLDRDCTGIFATARQAPCADTCTAGTLAQREPVTMDADPNTDSMAVSPPKYR